MEIPLHNGHLAEPSSLGQVHPMAVIYNIMSEYVAYNNCRLLKMYRMKKLSILNMEAIYYLQTLMKKISTLNTEAIYYLQ